MVTRAELVDAVFNSDAIDRTVVEVEPKLYNREYQCAFMLFDDNEDLETMAVFDQNNQEFERYDSNNFLVGCREVSSIEKAIELLSQFQKDGEFPDEEVC